MALSRRSGQRFQASIWPGFVDAMTALLLVLIFVLTIFMVVQSLLSETITGQESQLDRLSREVDTLARALGAEQAETAALEDSLAALGEDLEAAADRGEAQATLIESLSTELETREAALQGARDRIATLGARLADREAALADARARISTEAAEAERAAAEAAALEAVIADLRAEGAAQDDELRLSQERLTALQADLDETAQALTSAERARLAEAEAARALRERLENTDEQLTETALALEAERQRAEETLTLLAAAREANQDFETRLMSALTQGDHSEAALERAEEALAAARERLAAEGATAEDLRRRLAEAVAEQAAARADAQTALSRAEQQERLLSLAREELAEVADVRAEDRERLAALDAQVTRLRRQLGEIQSLLEASEAREAATEVELEDLGQRLNVALARAADEARRAAAEAERRADLEAAERERLAREAQRLETYQSEFFGRLRDILGDREGVRIVGDRFVFASEVLFASGSADLSAAGRAEIGQVALTLQEVAAVIPSGIDWVIRVDGHTDDVPVSSTSQYADNWELSQARALSVVRFMIDAFDFPPERLAATGFAEFQPIDPAGTAEARARNRRIELKLTER